MFDGDGSKKPIRKQPWIKTPLMKCLGQSTNKIKTQWISVYELQPFNGLFSRTTWVCRYQKGKTNLDFTGARNSGSGISWAICTSLQTDNHASTPPLYFLQAGCPSCRPTNSVKALKAHKRLWRWSYFIVVIIYFVVIDYNRQIVIEGNQETVYVLILLIVFIL